MYTPYRVRRSGKPRHCRLTSVFPSPVFISTILPWCSTMPPINMRITKAHHLKSKELLPRYRKALGVSLKTFLTAHIRSLNSSHFDPRASSVSAWSLRFPKINCLKQSFSCVLLLNTWILVNGFFGWCAIKQLLHPLSPNLINFNTSPTPPPQLLIKYYQ